MIPLLVIPDPELLLPDERLTPAQAYRAESAFFGRDYVSLAALIKGRKAVEERLNSQMATWQREMTTPTNVMYSVVNEATDERLCVYAHVPAPVDFIDSQRAAGVTDEVKRRRLVRKMENAHQRGWLYARWHSRTQPEGEYGVMHRAYVQREVPESEFLELAAKGWVA